MRQKKQMRKRENEGRNEHMVEERDKGRWRRAESRRKWLIDNREEK